MPVVQIPGVGNVQFPDTMKPEEVTQAAGKLYAQAQDPTPPTGQAPPTRSEAAREEDKAAMDRAEGPKPPDQFSNPSYQDAQGNVHASRFAKTPQGDNNRIEVEDMPEEKGLPAGTVTRDASGKPNVAGVVDKVTVPNVSPDAPKNVEIPEPLPVKPEVKPDQVKQRLEAAHPQLAQLDRQSPRYAQEIQQLIQDVGPAPVAAHIISSLPLAPAEHNLLLNLLAKSTAKNVLKDALTGDRKLGEGQLKDVASKIVAHAEARPDTNVQAPPQRMTDNAPQGPKGSPFVPPSTELPEKTPVPAIQATHPLETD